MKLGRCIDGIVLQSVSLAFSITRKNACVNTQDVTIYRAHYNLLCIRFHCLLRKNGRTPWSIAVLHLHSIVPKSKRIYCQTETKWITFTFSTMWLLHFSNCCLFSVYRMISVISSAPSILAFPLLTSRILSKYEKWQRAYITAHLSQR